MKKYLALLFMGFTLSAPSLHAETAHSICMAEARDAGIDDPDEIAIYVEECLSMMNVTGDAPFEESSEGSHDEFDHMESESDIMTE